MAKDLITYLKGRKCKGLKGKPVYFEDGDFVTFFCADDMAHEVRVDEVVTIYESFQTGNMVGCKIKGVKHLLSTIGNFGVLIQDHGAQIALGMLFMVAAMANPEKKEKYKDLGRRFGNAQFEPPTSVAA